jgi:hypothetical protein
MITIEDTKQMVADLDRLIIIDIKAIEKLNGKRYESKDNHRNTEKQIQELS